MRNRTLFTVALAMAVLSLVTFAGCKTSGMALTSRGQILNININHPKDLPEGGEDNIDVVISNRGVNNILDVLVDVDLPPQLIVLDQTADRGITVTHDPGSSSYHFVIGNIQPAEKSNVRFKVRTAFGTLAESDSVKVTAWQRNLPGDKLVETALIKLRR